MESSKSGIWAAIGGSIVGFLGASWLYRFSKYRTGETVIKNKNSKRTGIYAKDADNFAVYQQDRLYYTNSLLIAEGIEYSSCGPYKFDDDCKFIVHSDGSISVEHC